MPLKQVRNERFVTIPRDEYESMKATIETLEDEEVMEQLRKSWGASSKSLEKMKEEMDGQ